MKSVTATDKATRLRIILQDTPVWREVLVPSTLTMARLHVVIQAVMGWRGGDEWEFRRARQKISGRGTLNYELGRRGARLLYLHDFEQKWLHQVVLLDKPESAQEPLPVCIAGSMATPPDECGGLLGYEALVGLFHKTRPNPADKQRLRDAGEWNPEHFNLVDCNARLATAFGISIPAAAWMGSAAVPEPSFTPKQGQYLAFISQYTRLHRQPPAEADIQRFFGVSPPSVHTMIDTLVRKQLLERKPGQPRSLKILVAEQSLPALREPGDK